MRNLLSCLAIAMLVSFVGCGEPAAPAPAPTPDAPATEGSGTSSTAATSEMTEVAINVPGMT